MVCGVPRGMRCSLLLTRGRPATVLRSCSSSCCSPGRMGAAESVVRNVDKRTARRERRDVFMDTIVGFRAARCHGGGSGSNQRKGADDGGSSTGTGRAIRVCVRKRPMFEHETVKEKEFDVVTTLGEEGSVVVHDARMEKDMRHMFIDNHAMEFDRVFGDEADNDEVYAGTASELVRLAASGGQSTVMMYGQTGSGKTYTMSSIYERAAEELFEILQVPGGSTPSVFVSFVELAGDVCSDMLNEGRSGAGPIRPAHPR
eukprot:SAG25_NODE_943_length_4654_cov_5.645225_2_plen_258_part_00